MPLYKQQFSCGAGINFGHFFISHQSVTTRGLLVHLLYLSLPASTPVYHIDTDEIPRFLLLLKNHIFTVRSEDTIFIFHV